MNDYLLFDLDGTLTDPKVGITTCVQYALASFGIEEPDLDKLTPFIGPPLKDSFVEFYGFDEAKAQAAVEKYRERFKDTGLFENEVYTGIPDMLRKLKGNRKKLAVASSKPTVFVERILEHFEIRRYFDVVVGSELDGTRTDKAEVIAEALRQLYGENAADMEQKKKNTVMIGDRKFDVEGAKAEGVVSVAVSYGYGSMEELKEARPDYIVRSVLELEMLLLRGSGKEVTEPPMAKLWFIIFPALVYYFVREMGFYVGSFAVVMLAQSLPAKLVEKIAIWEEDVLVGVTGNGSAIMAIIAFAIAGIVMWKFFAKEDIGKVEKDVKLKHSCLKSPLAYACMVIGTLGMALGLNYLYELLGITNKSEAYKQTAELQYAAAIPLGLLLNGFIAPVAEELVFRGVVYNRLKKHMTYLYAIVFSALAFGVYHQNWVQGSYAFIMGCIMAWLYESFGHFYVPVIVHIISNVSAYLLSATGAFAAIGINWMTCSIFLAIGIAALLYCFMTWRAAGAKMKE